MSGFCSWSQEDDSDTWATQCGNYFTINEGSPSENKMVFCCFCGLLVAEHPTVDEEVVGPEKPI